MYLPLLQDWRNPYASPLLATNLEDLPPALFLTAELDILRDEGEAYGLKLKNSGVPAIHIRYPVMIHDFVGMDKLFDESEKAINSILAHLIIILQTP